MERGGYVYIMSNHIRSVFYIGVTSQLSTRIDQHKNGQGSVFTSKYNCTDLIYYEGFQFIEEAIKREKQMKKCKRDWKLTLIQKTNPQLLDLSDDVYKNRL
ncbi:MAG: endonuclease [Crocinitomicaceae bacterium]|nr:endonuclease [Crocinitomicaceae bacterium]